jgi:hypothetical protein
MECRPGRDSDIMKKLLLILCIPLLMGATYTVGPSGKNYTTIQGCLDVVVAGDTCDIYAGTYAELPITKASGSNSTTGLITIQAHGSDTVTLDVVSLNPAWHTYFHIAHNYIKVNGIQISNPGGYSQEGIILSGSNCQITNNRFYNGYMGNPGSYAINVTGSNNTISGNTIEGSTLSTGGTHTGSNAAATLTDSTKSWTTNALIGLRLFNQTNQQGCTVTANTSTTVTCTLSGGESWDAGDYYTVGPTFYIVFYNSGNSNTYSSNIIRNVVDVERIWDLYGDDNTIDGNEAYNLIWSGYGGIHPDIFQVVDSETATSKRNIIQNNYFHDLAAQIGINEMRHTSTDSWIFRNNIFANVTDCHNAPFYMHYTKVYNNTFYNCGGSDLGGAWDTGVEYRNNVIIFSSTNPGYGLLGTVGEGGIYSNNYYGMLDGTGRTEASIIASGDMNYVNGGDPKFIAPFTDCIVNTCNFQLQSDSPLKDAGATLTGFSTDKHGGSRPVGAAWDIGAYEYGSATVYLPFRY